jgi:Kef-type K+ transport system membrane component KefB
VGVALGDSHHLRNRTRSHIEEFISSIFAPIFFASIGLQIDFAASFELTLVVVVFIIACIGKLASGVLGGKLAGMSPRESWALAFGMNARGTIEIILGLLALKYGLISDAMFVALVIMAIGTSMLAGPAIERILQRRKPLELGAALNSKAFVDNLRADTRREGHPRTGRSRRARLRRGPPPRSTS